MVSRAAAVHFTLGAVPGPGLSPNPPINLKLKVDRGCRVGRNYHDYEVYLEQYPDTAVTQMDSVIESKGGTPGLLKK